MHPNAHCPCSISHQCNIIGIPPEYLNVLLNERQGLGLVIHAPVSRGVLIFRRQEAQGPQSVVHRNHNNSSGDKDLSRLLLPSAPGEVATVEPDNDWVEAVIWSVVGVGYLLR